MKKLFLILAVTLSVSEMTFSQIKITKTTKQKTFAGMGGVFMNYLIDFNSKAPEKIEIDSVKTIADSSAIKFGFTKFDPCCKNQISFGYALSQSQRCKTCPEVPLQQYDLTKGIIIYGRKNEKKFSVSIKKFKQLPDLKTP